ncbi:M48 metallopeptidase family protein [Actinoallomurus soli]|uniref:M48 metallopeptidase family protein n=1 Tax=Actinoallomurus soli TaxID=2952535 RepID=UPI002091E756|nr:M48 family metallopeptidase [Actinoallomurus soli]MCO5973950.1 M48 family metallopeptidase [Actinoallomurus soli]
MPPTGEIEVRRSARRRRTVTARRDGDKTVVMVPAGLSAAEEREWIDTVLERLAARERRRHPSDDVLYDRARELSRRYLGGRAAPASVRWVTNQRSRWGSCTPDDGTIRLSTQLRGMPGWVVDYVLMHELTHLIVPGHGPPFWELVNRYPRTERARGYLEGVAATAGLPLTDGDQPRERAAGAGGLPGRDGDPLLDGSPSLEADPLLDGDSAR